MDKLLTVWAETLQLLEPEMEPVSYRSWIQTINPISIKDNIIILEVPFPYNQRMVNEIYKPLITNALCIASGEELSINVVVKGDAFIEEVKEEAETEIYETPIEGFLNPYFTFENFVIGSSNKFAHAASLAVAEGNGIMYNPLFLYGGVGLGKTHLMHAIGNTILKTKPSKKVMYVSAEKFTNEFIAAVTTNTVPAFRDKYRTVDVLMIDDIQFIGGKQGIEEAFFHTFNDLKDLNKQIIISSDRPPRELHTLSERLKTRFENGLLADIQQPDFETRAAIITKKCSSFNLYLHQDVILRIASCITENIREIEGVLKKLKMLTELYKKPVDEEMLSKTLESFNTHENSVITPEIVIKAVERHFNLREDSLKSKSRANEISIPRQISMYIMKEMCTNISYIKMGAALGGRDHSTIIHGIKIITKKIEEDPFTKNVVDDIIKNIKNR